MVRATRLVFLAIVGLVLVGCSSRQPAARAASSPVEQTTTAFAQTGIASYYHDSLHGNTTASGVPYDRRAMTAAHRELPFGTRIRVTNLDNGRAVELVVNDRGPFVQGRIVDVSRRAAESLDFVQQGIVDVRLEVIG